MPQTPPIHIPPADKSEVLTGAKPIARVVNEQSDPRAEQSELPETILKALASLKLSEASIKNLRAALAKLPPKEAVEILMLRDAELGSPDDIRAKLIAALSPERLKTLPEVQADPKLLEALQALREAIVGALKSDSASLSPGLTKLAHIFFNFARTLGTKNSPEECLQADLKALIGAQTDYLKKIEERIRQFLSLPDITSGFEEVKQTLEHIRLTGPTAETPLIKEVLKFVRELKASFSGLTENSPELPKIIQDALETIGSKFLNNKQAELPRELTIRLKELQAKLVTLYSAATEPTTSDLHDILKSANEIREKLPSALRLSFEQKLQALESGMAFKDPLRPLLFDLQLNVSAILDPASRSQDSEPVPGQVTDSLKALSSALQKALTKLPKMPESDWQQLLPPGFDPLEAPEFLIAPGGLAIGKLTSIQIRAIKGIVAALDKFSTLKASGTELPPQLESVLSELSQEVDQAVKHQEPLKKEILQKALQQVSSAEQSVKNMAQQKDLLAGRVEQFIQGQETLQTLNQAMKILSQPSFVFMPLLVHGFLSQLELSIPNNSALNPDEKEKSPRSGKSKKDDEILFSLSLPSIGNVSVAMTHSQKSANVSITFEDEAVAEFMRKLLPQLESRLQSIGFDPMLTAKVDSHRASVKPAWLQELINPSRVIA